MVSDGWQPDSLTTAMFGQEVVFNFCFVHYVLASQAHHGNVLARDRFNVCFVHYVSVFLMQVRWYSGGTQYATNKLVDNARCFHCHIL